MTDQKIKIRALQISDTSRLAELANNKKIWDNLKDYIPYPYNESDAENFIELTQTQKPQQSFCIEYNDALCGVISIIVQHDVYRKSAAIGYWIGELYWKQGIATKAIQLITEYGFEKLDLI